MRFETIFSEQPHSGAELGVSGAQISERKQTENDVLPMELLLSVASLELRVLSNGRVRLSEESRLF